MVTGAATLTDVLSFKGPQEAPVAHCPPGKNPATKVLAKANALRKWLSVGTDGEASILELAKLRVTHQLGVQLRDLRLLDPQLAASYPSAILAREHALVVNLEFIKCIVTMEHAGAPPAMPFELRALEAVLDTVSAHLERATGELEAAAHPALDALTGAITTPHLERVRRIKNRMVRLTTRVETLREVLEKFLDDDSDMHDMNLTAKVHEGVIVGERGAGPLGAGFNDNLPHALALSFTTIQSMEREQLLQRTSLRGSVAGTPFDVPVTLSGGADGELGELAGMSPRTRRSASSASTDSSIVDEEVAAVEMLLEPYFMQVDNTYNKLQTLCEYIDDTEDYINIELDSHRNELIRLDLVLTALTASVALITAITSLFAMNLELSPGVQGQASREGPYWQFIVVSVVCCLAAAFIFTGVMVYCRWKRLI
ncbi:hypothetical protein APUTEX25_001089 [Auxenochlorella protothecoides]|uniref:Magnesium transporter n=1 Tax=Auxenochlorella protothecoides TaxID=3075 RepID=A0A3M7KT66_AUXPR|nr:hypothetical protein APUTEX25_001089 [Auxenochlorella protothecoides]|eukprot:RMZ52970.1 hypothetical protein APUTEX25_001089 [Auxenochlorella protothecoides]